MKTNQHPDPNTAAVGPGVEKLNSFLPRNKEKRSQPRLCALALHTRHLSVSEAYCGDAR